MINNDIANKNTKKKRQNWWLNHELEGGHHFNENDTSWRHTSSIFGRMVMGDRHDLIRELIEDDSCLTSVTAGGGKSTG